MKEKGFSIIEIQVSVAILILVFLSLFIFFGNKKNDLKRIPSYTQITSIHTLIMKTVTTSCESNFLDMEMPINGNGPPKEFTEIQAGSGVIKKGVRYGVDGEKATLSPIKPEDFTISKMEASIGQPFFLKLSGESGDYIRTFQDFIGLSNDRFQPSPEELIGILNFYLSYTSPSLGNKVLVGVPIPVRVSLDLTYKSGCDGIATCSQNKSVEPNCILNGPNNRGDCVFKVKGCLFDQVLSADSNVFSTGCSSTDEAIIGYEVDGQAICRRTDDISAPQIFRCPIQANDESQATNCQMPLSNSPSKCNGQLAFPNEECTYYVWKPPSDCLSPPCECVSEANTLACDNSIGIITCPLKPNEPKTCNNPPPHTPSSGCQGQSEFGTGSRTCTYYEYVRDYYGNCLGFDKQLPCNV